MICKYCKNTIRPEEQYKIVGRTVDKDGHDTIEVVCAKDRLRDSVSYWADKTHDK